MDKKTEAYEYGKRIGNDTAAATDPNIFLRNTHRWGKLRAMLRETAGFESGKTIYPSEMRRVQLDSYRKGGRKEEAILKTVVIPHFRRGFYEGLTGS